MTDIRARLADAQRKHRFERHSVSETGYFKWWGHCIGCGYESEPRTQNGPEWALNMRDDEAYHLADVLLSLPGIAIIEISEDEREQLKAAYEFFVSTCKAEPAAAVQAQEEQR